MTLTITLEVEVFLFYPMIHFMRVHYFLYQNHHPIINSLQNMLTDVHFHYDLEAQGHILFPMYSLCECTYQDQLLMANSLPVNSI